PATGQAAAPSHPWRPSGPNGPWSPICPMEPEGWRGAMEWSHTCYPRTLGHPWTRRPIYLRMPSARGPQGGEGAGVAVVNTHRPLRPMAGGGDQVDPVPAPCVFRAANSYPAQNARIASCSAWTFETPKAAAAASRPPNFVASAETLVPRQLLDPGTPANVGGAALGGCINTPKAAAAKPTGILAITVFVAVSIRGTEEG